MSAAASPVYDLVAVDSTTFDRVTTFGSSPTLTIAYDPSKPAPTAIYYIDPVNGPVALPSTVDTTAHTISAPLTHFSLYVAGNDIDGILDAIGDTLLDYANGVLAGTQTLVLTDDVHVGGLLAVTAPTLVFDNISFSRSSESESWSFTGTVGITATDSEIDASPFSGSTGAISGTYTLAGESSGGGTMRLSVESLSLAVDGLGSVDADTVVLVSTSSGDVLEVQLGATGVDASVGGGALPEATVSDATLAFVSRRSCDGRPGIRASAPPATSRSPARRA